MMVGRWMKEEEGGKGEEKVLLSRLRSAILVGYAEVKMFTQEKRRNIFGKEIERSRMGRARNEISKTRGRRFLLSVLHAMREPVAKMKEGAFICACHRQWFWRT